MLASDLYRFIFDNISNAVIGRETDQISKIILEHYFGCKSEHIIKNENIFVNEDDLYKLISEISKRLMNYEPIQYIIGETMFLNCRIFLDRNVLIPRQETEEMVYNILKIDLNGKKVIDICSGSGCIGISIKKNSNASLVSCLDISKEALSISLKSAKFNKVDVHFINLDIFNDMMLKIDDYDVIISNPPYIPIDEKPLIEKNVLMYEPHIALFVSKDKPLKFYERLKTIINKKLSKGGVFFLEINENFANDILLLFTVDYIAELKISKDINGKDRWVSGVKI